jgi:hypothetical protein
MHYTKSSPFDHPNHDAFRFFKTCLLAFICCALTISAASCGGGRADGSKKDSVPVKAVVRDTVAGGTAQMAADATNATYVTTPDPIDTSVYHQRLRHMVNGDSSGRWPVRTVTPLPGSILPFKRIVAYYGNLYSKKMGVLGEYPPAEMLKRLKAEVKKWETADTSMPVQPALHYICVTAQGSAGKDGKYRARMPFKQIDSVLHMAARINAIVFLDIQVGFSNVESEVPQLEKYLKMPQVHLGIDPEFSMHPGKRIGKNIGTMDAADVNFCSNYLTKLVKANHLPPKILVVHRFTRPMISNYKNITLHPEVQIVMDMDGWGDPILKLGSYKDYESHEPVQFTGFKLFYKNDIKNKPFHMMTPQEVLRLKPQPVYIQYQ